MKKYLDFSQHSMEIFWDEWQELENIYVENLRSIGNEGDQAFAALMNKYNYLGVHDWETTYSGIGSKILGFIDYSHSSAEVYISSYIELITMLEEIKSLCSAVGKNFTYTVTPKRFGDVVVDTNCIELNNLFPGERCALNSTCTSMKAIEAFKRGVKFVL